MGLIVKDESNHFSWFYNLNRFFYKFLRRFVSSHDYHKAIDPALQNLTVGQGEERGRIDNYIVVAMACLLQNFSKVLRLEYFMGSGRGLLG
jgi:hypothetical protein